MALAMSGMTSDARIICKTMRNECLNHNYAYETFHPVERLVEKISSKAGQKTNDPSSRPYGVGLLVIG
jgi:20S proteasome subunit alpha 6